MNNNTISHSSKSSKIADDISESTITSPINKLVDSDDSIHVYAREKLISIGKPAVQPLMKNLTSSNPQIRWQIIKALEEIRDPEAASALVIYMEDENAGVRWAASDALISLGHAALPPILEALKDESDSVWLYRLAHHVLHVLKDRGFLTPSTEQVYRALEGVEPSVEVPWAAEKAVEELHKV
jgi:HEAT repeat protein